MKKFPFGILIRTFLLCAFSLCAKADGTPPVGWETSSQESTSKKISTFMKDERCSDAFLRLGHLVTPKECVAIGKKARLPILWYRQYLDKPAEIFPDVKEGQSFSVTIKEGVTTYRIHKE